MEKKDLQAKIKDLQNEIDNASEIDRERAKAATSTQPIVMFNTYMMALHNNLPDTIKSMRRARRKRYLAYALIVLGLAAIVLSLTN